MLYKTFLGCNVEKVEVLNVRKTTLFVLICQSVTTSYKFLNLSVCLINMNRNVADVRKESISARFSFSR